MTLSESIGALAVRSVPRTFCLHEEMNAEALSAHKIAGIKNVLVDGFKHRLFDIKDASKRYFILTHFHSDHYTGILRLDIPFYDRLF